MQTDLRECNVGDVISVSGMQEEVTHVEDKPDGSLIVVTQGVAI